MCPSGESTLPWTNKHLSWLTKTEEVFTTADGKEIEVWQFTPEYDDEILSAWAKHFRNHYCSDSQIDIYRGRMSRDDFLTSLKFPSTTGPLGPPTRSGDFGEILVADYLQWVLGYWVPRVRWDSKIVRDSSPQGCDVVGLLSQSCEHPVPTDSLFVFEVKASLSNGGSKTALHRAVKDSAKDHLRIDESLNYVRQRMAMAGDMSKVNYVGRFQSPVDVPYEEKYCAAAVFEESNIDSSVVSSLDTSRIPKNDKDDVTFPHPHRDSLAMIIIKGNNMMNLVHELYRRAASEA